MIIGNGHYKIESDPLNYTLYERNTSSNTGVEYWRAIAFFSNLRSAVDHLATLELAKTGLSDLREVLRRQDEIEKIIRSIIPVKFATGTTKQKAGAGVPLN